MFKIVRKEETASSALAKLSVSVASSKNKLYYQFRIGLMKPQWEFPIGKKKQPTKWSHNRRRAEQTKKEMNWTHWKKKILKKVTGPCMDT